MEAYRGPCKTLKLQVMATISNLKIIISELINNFDLFLNMIKFKLFIFNNHEIKFYLLWVLLLNSNSFFNI